MDPTTTNPFTTLDPSLTKTLRPSYVAVPIIPFHTIQVQTPPPQSVPPPRQLDSAFWDVATRTVEYSARGAVALAWLFSTFPEVAPRKVRSGGTLFFFQSKVSLGSTFPGTIVHTRRRRPFACRRLRAESILFSELYLEEEDFTCSASCSQAGASRPTHYAPHRIINPTLILVSGYPTTPASAIKLSKHDSGHPPEGYLPSEDLSVPLHTPGNELYFNPKSPGAAPLSTTRPLETLAVPAG